MKHISTLDGLEIRGLKIGLFATAVLFACSPQFVVAQGAGGAGANVLEEIVVTGSNIRRNRDFETPSPIQTVDNEMIQAAGIGQMQDLLRILPANAGSELNAQQSDRQGTTQFSLRGLGVGGTLTLINGRRAGIAPVTTNQGFFYTDINQYPPNMIERVEVLLDGASATYGSEAVGGVVNFITRTDFEGLEVGVEYRDNENNPAESFNVAFGAGFDQGHFTTFVNYFHQERGHRGDYDWLSDRADGTNTTFVEANNPNLFDSSTGAGRYNAASDPDGDGFYQRSGNTVPDPNCGMPNPLSEVITTFLTDGPNCRYIFLNQRTLVADEQRLQVFSQFDYDLSDTVSIFSEMSYSFNEIKDTIGGAVMDLRFDDDGHFIPASHPFNYFVDNAGTLTWDPTAVAADPTQAVDVIVRQRPLTTYDSDLGEDITRQFVNTRIAVGFDADLSDRWSLYGSYVYSHTNLNDVQPRSYYTPAFRDAIAAGNWNPFASGWATPNAVSVKDGITIAGNTVYGSDSDLSAFSVNRTFVKDTKQQVFEFILSGDMFDIGGNIGGVAFGVQYRDTEFTDIADSLSEFRIDGRTDPVFSVEDGDQSVLAIFGEASVPVSDTLEVQVAVRYEDYGSDQGGDSTDPKIGFRWAATDAFMLRGTIGTSFQAPSIRNIEGSVGSGVLADPILTGINPGDACDLAMTDSFNAGQITTGGGLVPQDATNWNLGAVWTSGNFTGSIDYWSYDFDDLIGPGQSHGSIVSGECSNGVYVPDPRVGRNSGGQLRNVTTSFLNLGGVDADGIDLTATYTFDNVMGGQLVLDAMATLMSSFDIDFGDGSPSFDGLNNRNSFIDLLGSVPDFRLNVGVNWMGDQSTAGLYVRHIGGYDDREPGITHNSIDDNTVVDLRYGYTFGESTTLTVGINNVGDEDPPAIDRGSVAGRVGFDQQVHDPRGRVTYLRLDYTF